MRKAKKLAALFTIAALGTASYIALKQYQGFGVNKAPIHVVFFDNARTPVTLLKMPRPLDLAIKAGDLDRVESLLKQGASPNLTTHFSGPALNDSTYMVADLEMMKLLVRYGADVNQPNLAGATAVHYVIASLIPEKREPAFRYLLSIGGDMDSQKNSLGYTPRQWLMHFNDPGMVAILKEYDQGKIAVTRPQSPTPSF